MTKNSDPYKYSYFGYIFWFDVHDIFSLRNGEFGKKLIFGADRSLSAHTDNKNKDILILCKGPKRGLDDTTLT